MFITHYSLLSEKKPSPLPATSFLGSTSTSLLSRLLSSGVMTFSTSFFCSGAFPVSRRGEPFDGGGWALAASDDAEGEPRLGRARGAGKLGFLSIVSISLLNRRKRDSARIKVESRSMLPESSLTDTC